MSGVVVRPRPRQLPPPDQSLVERFDGSRGSTQLDGREALGRATRQSQQGSGPPQEIRDVAPERHGARA